MKISLALSTYNGAEFLADQLESLRCQTLLPFELQVSDDGSTDDTLAVLERFAKTAPFPVLIVRNAANLGYGLSFLETARRCSGDWIAFCDQDDVWSANKLRRCQQAVEQGPKDLLLIVHNASITDADLTTSRLLDVGPFGTFKRGMLPYSYVAHGFRQMFKRDLLTWLPDDPCMGWLDYPHAHDNWVCVMASLNGSVVVLDEDLALYRRHGATATAIGSTTLEQAAQQSFRNNGEIYRRDAGAFRSFARELRAADPSVRKGVDLVDNYAEMLEKRADVYLTDSRKERARALLQLLSMRAYGTKSGWQFRPKSLAKDVVQVCVGSR